MPKGWPDMTYVHGTLLGAAVVSTLFLGILRAQTGDVSRGRTAVESSGCFDCHRVGDRGSRVGPDLSDIGGRRTPEGLRQSLVAPDDEVLPEHRSVRVVTRDTGGGFGQKIMVQRDEQCLMLAARKVDAPVKWVEDRSENLTAAGQSRHEHADVAMAFDADGMIQAAQIDFVSDCGAYPTPVSR